MGALRKRKYQVFLGKIFDIRGVAREKGLRRFCLF
mgnify:CR=1 FL=1